MIIGTTGKDRLNGSDGNDFFEGLAGDDEFKGRGGTDTAILSGSIWDYSWRSYSTSRGTMWEVTDENALDGDTGTDTLDSVEILRFDDAEITLGQEQPVRLLTELPDELRVIVGETSSFDVTFEDLDDREMSIQIHEFGGDLPYGTLSALPDYDGDYRYGEMSIRRSYTFTYDGTPRYGDSDPRVLAEDEEFVQMMEIIVTTRNIWLDGTFGDGSGFEYTKYQIPLIIVGVNDAPTISGTGTLRAFEDGRVRELDLSGFGSDIDSDDDGHSLTYEIVSAPHGFQVSIAGNKLRLDPSNLQDNMTSDERMRGTVEIRAIDRHGAASEGTITLDLVLRGKDDTPPPSDYLTSSGGIDYGAMGVDPANATDLGALYAWSGYSDPDVIVPLLIGFSHRGDTFLATGTRLASFSDDSGYSVDGTRVLDSTAFRMAGGDDAFVYIGAGGPYAGVELTDVFTGKGEDIISVDLSTTERAIINGSTFKSGGQSDRVLLHAEAPGEVFLTGSVETGSGHDVVDLRVANPNASGTLSGFVVDESVRLGSGNDTFNFTAVSAGARSLSRIELAISAGIGDDVGTVSTIGLGPNAALSAAEDPTGVLRELYRGGLEGSVTMGGGDDVLTLDLAAATFDVSAELRGDGYSNRAKQGYDVLHLNHLVAGTFSSSTVLDIFGEEGMRIVDGYQTLDIWGFEEIRLADNSLLVV